MTWKNLIAIFGFTLTLPVYAGGMDQGDPLLTKIMVDRLESRNTDAGRQTYLEGQAWIGHDLNKLWLKTEDSWLKDHLDSANLEALYSHAVAPFWDAQIGVRHDFSVNGAPSRNWVAVAMKGLAPYLFDIDATAYLGNDGRSAARLKAEYSLLLTQRLVLMPELEVNLYGKADPQRQLGTGLSDSDIALRLRYDINRKIAPYVGVVWSHLYGGTADYARAAGDSTSDTQYVVGVRAWW